MNCLLITKPCRKPFEIVLVKQGDLKLCQIKFTMLQPTICINCKTNFIYRQILLNEKNCL